MFADRIVKLDAPRRIETSKHVSGLDDVFADHFPGYPVLPGALVVEAFAQACQLLIALSREFSEVGRLRRVARFGRPGPCRERGGPISGPASAPAACARRVWTRRCCAAPAAPAARASWSRAH